MSESPADAFTLLGIECRPLLDPETVQTRYRQLAAQWHPDSPQGDAGRFAALTRARDQLLDPASRLRLLSKRLRSHSDSSPSPFLPPQELFSTIHTALELAKSAIEQRRSATTAIAKAASLQKIHQARAGIRDALARMKDWRAKTEASLSCLDAAWPDISPSQLETLAAEFSFQNKWNTALEEMAFSLEE